MRCSHDPQEATGASASPIPVSRRAALWNRLEKKWSQIQVGHQGTYSIERLELLHEYCQTTSLSRAILVCLLTPLPALLAAILLECLPLRPTAEGWAANWMFWIRHSLVTFVIFAAGNRQLDLYVPENNISVCRQLSLTLLTCVVQMGTYIGEAVLVGFPVPFMWQFGVLSVGICVPIMTWLIYGRVFFAKGSALQQEYKNLQDTIFMNLIVTGVYPFCRVLYDFLPQAYQGVVVIVLSIWKFAAKRFAVRMSRPVEDFIPELVAFSVDFFGSLFISVCMSTSGSFYLTALFIAVDVVHLVAKLREISSDEETILEMLQTRRQRSKWLSKSADCGDLVVMIVTVVRNPGKFRVASLNGVRLWANPPHLIPKEIYRHLQTLESTTMFGPRATAVARTVFSDEKSRYRLTSWVIRRTATHIVPSPMRLGLSADATHSFREKSRPDHLVRHGLQLLFRFEYLMLVEYIECVVPFVYLAYKSVLEQLPNVVYYPCGSGKWGVTAVTNLLVFGVLEVGSLVLVHFFLRRKFAFSPLHQLAFVLETQFYTVQASLFSLMLFTLQCQLAHLEIDVRRKLLLHSTPVSKSCVVQFAREQAAQDVPGANKAAQDWLRTRAGRVLRSLWLADEPPRRQTYILNNAGDTFPLQDYPKGIVDGRKDRRRYPRMVRADVSTPQVVQEASAAVQAGNSSNDQDITVVKALDSYRGELVRAALAAEVTALARAIKGGAIEDVVSRAAAIVECMGAQIMSELSPSARQRVVGITSDVAAYVRAATTQMTMYTDGEVNAAIADSVTRVRSADQALCSYVRSTMHSDPKMKTMYQEREKYRAVSTAHLRHCYWLATVSTSASVECSAFNQDDVPTCGEATAIEATLHTGDFPRKRLRIIEYEQDLDTAVAQVRIVNNLSGARGTRIASGVIGDTASDVGTREADVRMASAEDERSSGDVDNECHNEASASDEGNNENHDDASASDNGDNEHGDENSSDRDDVGSDSVHDEDDSDDANGKSAHYEEGFEGDKYQSSESESSICSDGSVYEETSAKEPDAAPRVPNRRVLRQRQSHDDALLVWVDCQGSGFNLDLSIAAQNGK